MIKKNKKPYSQDLGVVTTEKNVFLYFHLAHKNQDTFRMGVSSDGFRFQSFSKIPQFLDIKGKEKQTNNLTGFRISQVGGSYICCYREYPEKNIRVARSNDLVTWQAVGKLPISETGMLVPTVAKKSTYIFFFGERNIKVTQANDLKKWPAPIHTVLAPRESYFDRFPLEMGSVIPTQSGVLLIYYVRVQKREGSHYMVGAALFDSENPSKLLWRRSHLLWEQPDSWDTEFIYPLGAVRVKRSLVLYFAAKEKGVFAVSHESFDELLDLKKILSSPVLDKVANNPIIKPVLEHRWESRATFNPAAIHVDNKVHFIYRAIGEDNTSVLGYASSSDGASVDVRLDKPAYIPKEPFELPGGVAFVPYMSGGGYGGCEDPRLTKIGRRIYLTYVAFDGWNPPRIAITSIDEKDFLAKRWKWAQSKIISKPGVVDKNACLFPEKIRGKYVMMHRIFPNILIDFLDDLEFRGDSYLQGEYAIRPRSHAWDSRKIGAGAPPIKTKDGWLLIYHAVDDRNDSQYKIGAMLLDHNDPTKVLYWSVNPILHPTDWYENEGHKAGVAYPCGAVVKENNLFVYYGGADVVVCAAKKALPVFLQELQDSSKVWPEETIAPRRVPTYHD